MNCFKHSVFFADVCAACSAYAALEFSCFVCDDIAVKIGKNENLEICSSLLVDELCGCDIDIPFVSCDFGIFLADLFAEIKEFTISCFDNICFVDNRYSFFAVFPIDFSSVSMISHQLLLFYVFLIVVASGVHSVCFAAFFVSLKATQHTLVVLFKLLYSCLTTTSLEHGEP